MADVAKRSRALPPSLAAAVTGKPPGHATRRPRSPTATNNVIKRKQPRPSPSPTPDTTTADDEHKEQEPPTPHPTTKRQLFTNCTFVILLGIDITAGRRDVWKSAIEKRGGHVLAAVGREVTHVVVPTDFNGWRAWRDGVRDKYVRRWKVVRAEWMVQTLTKGVLSADSRTVVNHMAKVQFQADPASSSNSSNSGALMDESGVVPSSPPLLSSYPSDMPPLSPALSQQSTPTPSPVKYPPPQPSPSLSEPHLSVPNSDGDDDDILPSHPTMKKPLTEYLIEPHTPRQPLRTRHQPRIGRRTFRAEAAPVLH